MAEAQPEARPEPEIRGAHSADLPWLYEVCRATVDLRDYPGMRHEELDPYLVGQLYMAPYLAFEPAAAVVLTVNGRVQGYTLGTSDSRAFEAFLGGVWLPQVRTQYPRDLAALAARDRAFLETLHKPRTELPPWIDHYPAHLHADLLPACQGQGFGRKLLSHFLDYLRERTCVGVHVDVARSNPGAIAFYRALGLDTVIEETASGIVLGQRLG